MGVGPGCRHLPPRSLGSSDFLGTGGLLGSPAPLPGGSRGHQGLGLRCYFYVVLDECDLSQCPNLSESWSVSLSPWRGCHLFVSFRAQHGAEKHVG